MTSWLEVAKFSVPIVISIGASLYAFFATRRKDVDTRLGKLEVRTASLEQSVSVMPDKEDTHQILLQLTELSGDLRTLKATVDGQAQIMHRVEQQLGRHDDFLRRSSGT